MKALNILELDSFCDLLKPLVGAELQSVVVSTWEFALRFHGEEHGSFWVIVDMNPQAPVVMFTEKFTVKLPKVKKPVGLFLEANFLGEKLTGCERPREYGRVLNVFLSNERSIQLRLFPHGQNMILQAGEKSVALQKPKDLEALGEGEWPQEGRSQRTIYEEWVQSRNQRRPKKASKDKAKVVTKGERLKKLSKALDKLGADLEKKQSSHWRAAGQWLAENQSLEGVPGDYAGCIDLTESFSWNLENCYARAKKNEEKVVGLQQRMKELLAEKEDVEQIPDQEYLNAELKRLKAQPAKKFELKSKQPIKTRKLELPSGAAIYVGKSAKDNLQLLRKSRAWDLWLHIKDIPSAHAIIFRDKRQKITDSELQKAGAFLVEMSQSNKDRGLASGRVELLVAETRYVTPIKGDKHGRVIHKNARTVVVVV